MNIADQASQDAFNSEYHGKEIKVEKMYQLAHESFNKTKLNKKLRKEYVRFYVNELQRVQ